MSYKILRLIIKLKLIMQIKRVNQDLSNPSVWIDIVNAIITIVFKFINLFTRKSNQNNNTTI